MGIMQLLMSSVASGEKKYIDDLFSIDLYDGNSGTRTITNGIDLDGEGGMVWFRPTDYNAGLSPVHDSVRGWANRLSTSSDDDQLSYTPFTSINNNGFTIGNVGTAYNDSSYDYVAWTFRKCPGFFDVIEYTGNGAVQAINHNLECKPGCIIVKNMEENSTNWTVWHKNLDTMGPGGTVTECLKLNSTAAQDGGDWWGGTLPTSTQFSVGHPTAPKIETNKNGIKYIAYLFADGDESDAQVFGAGGDKAIVKCGLVQMDSSGYIPDVDLGFEPQWMIYKAADNTAVSSSGGNWDIMDVTRRWNIRNGSDGGNMDPLRANINNAESSGAGGPAVRSTGFGSPAAVNFGSNAKYIYIAISREDKPAEVATNVFSAGTRSGSGSVAKTTSTVFADMSITCRLDSTAEYNSLNSRLLWNETFKTNAETAYLTGLVSAWDTMTGMYVTGSNGAANTGNLVDYSFKRQPGFFDVAVYDGDASNNAVTVYHNLGVKPELIITKCDTLSTTGEWRVTCPAISGTISGGSNDGSNYDFISGYLSRNNYFSWNVYNATQDLSQDVTATTITYAGNSSGGNASVNYAGRTYISYLFASKAGISAIGQYTGTGSAVNVDCGFSAPARFVLIKRIGLDPVEATGDWYIYDSARGISSGSGNDPYYLLNLTASEVTGTDYIDEYASGFTVTSSAPAALNSTGTYLYLAIA